MENALKVFIDLWYKCHYFHIIYMLSCVSCFAKTYIPNINDIRIQKSVELIPLPTIL